MRRLRGAVAGPNCRALGRLTNLRIRDEVLVAEAYAKGVSTHRIEDVAQAIGIDGLSPSQTSRVSAGLDAEKQCGEVDPKVEVAVARHTMVRTVRALLLVFVLYLWVALLVVSILFTIYLGTIIRRHGRHAQTVLSDLQRGVLGAVAIVAGAFAALCWLEVAGSSLFSRVVIAGPAIAFSASAALVAGMRGRRTQ